jgi:hypothetical protein
MLRYNKDGKFNIPYGRYKTINYIDLQNKAYEELLSRTEVLNESFEYLFDNYNDANNFMFLDPPYDSEFTDYGYCKFGKEEQKKLATLFKITKIKCLMIIGKTPFIIDLYKDYIYNCHENSIVNKNNNITYYKIPEDYNIEKYKKFNESSNNNIKNIFMHYKKDQWLRYLNNNKINYNIFLENEDYKNYVYIFFNDDFLKYNYDI